MSPGLPVLAVDGLAKAYGGVRALDGVSFGVRAGELLALIGPNGAGKSTCFNIVDGQIRPDAGTVRLAGRDITGRPPRAIARRGVGRTFQISTVFASMTVRQNIETACLAAKGASFGLWRAQGGQAGAEVTELLAQTGLSALADRPAAGLAYGDVKRLELAMALAGSPRLLLMDEPTAGMGAHERLALIGLVRDLAAARELAVLFTEHSMDVVFGHATRVIVLARGRLIADGTVEEVRADPQVRAIYLGGDRRPAPIGRGAP